MRISAAGLLAVAIVALLAAAVLLRADAQPVRTCEEWQRLAEEHYQTLEELARSHECFFGADRSYHEARSAFVYTFSRQWMDDEQSVRADGARELDELLVAKALADVPDVDDQIGGQYSSAPNAKSGFRR